MEEEINDLKREVAVLNERVSNFMSQTTEYRKSLCNKVDSITSKIEDLPCPERKGKYESLSIQVNAIWFFIAAIIIAIIGEYFKV